MDFREAYDRIVQDKCKFMCSMPEDQPCPDACIWRTMLYALKKQIRLEPKTDRLRIGVGRCKCGRLYYPGCEWRALSMQA